MQGRSTRQGEQQAAPSAPEATLGALLRRYRRAAGLTQEELAERATLSVASISKIERGLPHVPRSDTVQLLARALALSPEAEATLAAAVRAARVHSNAGSNADAHVLADGLHASLRAPLPPTVLIGRDELLTSLCDLLHERGVRLLTLVGAPGVGKTHLALAAAHQLADAFSGGVAFVALAPLRDAGLVPTAIARALGVKDDGTQPLIERIGVTLRERTPLLLLDNVEHLLPGAAEVVAELLTACPELIVLVTGRAALHVRGEYERSVPPLALPDPALLRPWQASGASGAAQTVDASGVDALDALVRTPAVALFIERACAACPDFRLTAANAAAVAAICARLDGLPLALELAAPRLKLLTLAELLAQLEGQRLQVLTHGPSDLPERQRTLRHTLEWSYQLLGEDERALFRRLGVFVGGATLEATQAVYAPSTSGEAGRADPFNFLSTLIEQHLIQHTNESPRSQGGASRFTMLETVREYAWEQLVAYGELADAQRAHTAYFLELAEAAEPHLRGPEQAPWLATLDQEVHNLRAALDWCVAAGQTRTGLRLASVLWRFWDGRGLLSEGRERLERALALAEAAGATESDRAEGRTESLTEVTEGTKDRKDNEDLMVLRGNALNAAGILAWRQGDYARAQALLERALALRRQCGGDPPRGVASSLGNLAIIAAERGDYARAEALFAESLALRRREGDLLSVAMALNNLGTAAIAQSKHERASAALEECLVLHSSKLV